MITAAFPLGRMTEVLSKLISTVPGFPVATVKALLNTAVRVFSVTQTLYAPVNAPVRSKVA
jgi:hypothetical protein